MEDIPKSQEDPSTGEVFWFKVIHSPVSDNPANCEVVAYSPTEEEVDTLPTSVLKGVQTLMALNSRVI